MTYGHKTGGRQKGSINKITLSIRERLKEMEIDPLEGLAEIASQARADGNLELAYKCYKDLLPYCYAKAEGVIQQVEEIKEETDRNKTAEIMLRLIESVNKSKLDNFSVQEITEAEILQPPTQEELIEN